MLIERSDLSILLVQGLLNKTQSDWALEYLKNQINWQQDQYNYSGRIVKAPRLTALYGASAYTYSGQTKIPNRWTKPLDRLRTIANKASNAEFNIVLLNWYRSGSDSVSWHSDNEPALGSKPIIGSFSFGTTRVFTLRNNCTKEIIQIPLAHGDFLVMRGDTQQCWQHCIPKVPGLSEERINLTFRTIIPH